MPLETTYRPAPRVPSGWLTGQPPGREEDHVQLAIPDFDEDEATMAVAALDALCVAGRVPPAGLGQVVLRSPTGRDFARPVAQALGLPFERVVEAPSGSADPKVGAAPVALVDVESPRPGGAPPRPGTLGAYAAARLIAKDVEDDLLEIGPRPRTLERERVDKMARWEREALLAVPMGAYVPQSTWDAHATARARLVGSRCKNGHTEFPGHTHCGRCRQSARPHALPRPGHLDTFTVVGAGGGPTEFDPLMGVQGSYAVGVASFGDARAPGLLVETPFDGLRIGLPVRPVFRRLYAQEGRWRYGAKFEPL